MIDQIEDIELFQGLSAREREVIQSSLHEKTFQKGELLFFEGNPCERIFLIRSGRVKVYRSSPSGREQTLRNIEPGDTCACHPGIANWDCTATAVALEPTTVWFLSRPDYNHLTKSNLKLSQTLSQLFAERLRSFSGLIEEISLKDAKKRLIKFLLDMLEHNQDQGSSPQTLQIPFTREEIAHRLGTARETVARYLSQLKASGLIDLKPKQIIILDVEALKKHLS